MILSLITSNNSFSKSMCLKNQTKHTMKSNLFDFAGARTIYQEIESNSGRMDLNGFNAILCCVDAKKMGLDKTTSHVVKMLGEMATRNIKPDSLTLLSILKCFRNLSGSKDYNKVWLLGKFAIEVLIC